MTSSARRKVEWWYSTAGILSAAGSRVGEAVGDGVSVALGLGVTEGAERVAEGVGVGVAVGVEESPHAKHAAASRMHAVRRSHR
jgi:hypothetical protein